MMTFRETARNHLARIEPFLRFAGGIALLSPCPKSATHVLPSALSQLLGVNNCFTKKRRYSSIGPHSSNRTRKGSRRFPREKDPVPGAEGPVLTERGEWVP